MSSPPSLPHEFENAELLERALTHASTDSERNNERLEFLGDAALDLVVAEDLFDIRPRISEGDMTERKARVVSRASLATAAGQMQLGRMARLGGGLSSRTLSRSVLANLYEAVLGAVYLDGGLEAARTFVRKTLAPQLETVSQGGRQRSTKQRLQEAAQKDGGQPPQYVVLEQKGRTHAQAFLVEARVGEHSFPSAWGRTRKEAESWAAYEALLILEDASLG